MIASILAANMSTCSAFLVDSGALFTEGLYRQRLVPNRPDRHYLWVGRVSGFVITMAGVLYAMYLIESVLYTFLLTETLATFVGISVLGGILWPRANRWGALASLVSSLATNFLLYYATGQRLDHWDANVFLAALVVGIAALVGVSLLTAPEPAAQTDSFFARLQTSSDEYIGCDEAVAAAKKEVRRCPAAPARQPVAPANRRCRARLEGLPRRHHRFRHRVGDRVCAGRRDDGLASILNGPSSTPISPFSLIHSIHSAFSTRHSALP